MEDHFASLRTKIDVVKQFEWGLNTSKEGFDDGYTHCFIGKFDSAEDHDNIYQPHEAHQAFVAVLKPHLESIRAIDFYGKRN